MALNMADSPHKHANRVEVRRWFGWFENCANTEVSLEDINVYKTLFQKLRFESPVCD